MNHKKKVKIFSLRSLNKNIYPPNHPGKNYRFILSGERFGEGDEVWLHDILMWYTIGRMADDATVNSKYVGWYRRKIEKS